MALHIRDPKTDRLARELARLRGTGITEAVRSALEDKLSEERSKVPLLERVRDIIDELNAHPDPDFKPDKAFFDWLSGEEDD